jgi:hypothetical protein
MKPKCRIVALGHCDPDLETITRPSPTPGRTTEHVMYALAVAGLNGELGRNSLRWKCWLGDAAPAFLQPDSERQLPLYMADHEIHLSISLPFGKPISISLREYSWASQCTALVVSRSHRPAP